MNRIATTAAAAIIGGFALLALTACQSGLDGAGAPQVVVSQVAATGSLAADVTPVTSAPTTSAAHQSSGAAADSAVAAGAVAVRSGAASGSGTSTTATHSPTTSTKPATGPGSGSGPGTGPKTGAGNGSGTGHQSTTSGSDASTPAPSIVSASISCDFSNDDQTYHENLSYEVAGATGMALSIDNPGIVGSFGSYDWHGTIEIPNLGCYTVNGPQTYTLYTVGGTGPQASKTIVRTGTHTHAGATTTTSTSATPAPSIVSASISCDFSNDDQTYHENLSYEVAGATGMALSIDNPGIVGSFGTYDWTGTIEIPNLGCYTVNGPQTYTLYTVGGTGPQASKTIVRTGTHTHSGTAITPAPVAQTTSGPSSQLPTPSATSQLPTPSAATQLPTPSAASSATTSTTSN